MSFHFGVQWMPWLVGGLGWLLWLLERRERLAWEKTALESSRRVKACLENHR